jgi:hypothetical protein
VKKKSKQLTDKKDIKSAGDFEMEPDSLTSNSHTEVFESESVSSIISDSHEEPDIEIKFPNLLISTGDYSERLSPLAPLILLQKNETPLTFEESITSTYKDKDKFDQIFFQDSLKIGRKQFLSLTKPEIDYGLKEEEALSIYFYTLEWSCRELSLYYRLNKDLTSNQRNSTAPIWKHYLYYLFNALRKVPIWKGNQDIYRGVGKNLVKHYPKKYIEKEEITWYAITSATTSSKCIQSFLTKEESTIFCINRCVGRHIKSLSSHPEEDEVLLPPESSFIITSIFYQPIDSDHVIIQLEQNEYKENRYL